MNNFTMTCQECSKTFTLTDQNRRNWIQGLCDTCKLAKSLDHNAKMTIRLTEKGRKA